MLCPVLLCATLLLLTPVEITEARALHPSPDAVQVQRERGEGGGKEKEYIKENSEWMNSGYMRPDQKEGRVMKCISNWIIPPRTLPDN